jgi:hypothetical protein
MSENGTLRNIPVRSEVLMAVSIANIVFWDLTLNSLVERLA